MQDTMHPASETFQSTSRVARYLVDQELPWLEGVSCLGFFLWGGRIKAGECFIYSIHIFVYDDLSYVFICFFHRKSYLRGDINPCLFARGIYTMFLIDATPMLGWSDYLRSKRRRDVFLFSDVKETVTFL